jgi:hypothetical protein
MDILLLDNKPWSYIRFGLGILSLIAALSFLLADIGDLRLFDYFMIVTFTLTGLIHITNDFGMQKTYLRYNNDCLVIKWISKFRPQSVSYTEIENICLCKTEIIINKKADKSIKLKLLTFRIDQKREIYRFFIKLSGDHELNLSKQFA